MKDFKIALPALVIAGVFTGCSDAQRQDTQEAEAATAEGAERVTSDFVNNAEEAVSDLTDQLDDLDVLYENASDAAASGWASTRAEIVQGQQDLEADLARLRNSSGQEAQQLEQEIATDYESLTATMNRARLDAAETNEEFVNGARETLASVEDALRVLQAESGQLAAEARQSALMRVDQLRSEADQLEQTVSGLADATAEEVTEARGELTSAIASLSASVRRAQFEIGGHDGGM